MALYFRVDIGYCNSGNTIAFNDVVWTDTDKYLPIISSYYGGYPDSEKTVEEFQSACESAFGGEFELMTAFPARMNGGYLNAIWQNGWLPWAKYLAPIIWSVINTSETNGKYTIIYFKDLGKALCRDTRYNYNSQSNSFITPDYNRCDYIPCTSEQRFVYPIIMNYSSPADFSEPNNWFYLEAYVNSTDRRGSSVQYSASNYRLFMTWLFTGAEPVVIKTDPYSPGDETTTGGGTGNFDGTSDDISIPSLPTLSATDTGFITLFNPTLGQLQSLANYMWSSGFDLSTFKKIFADPMDCILGLSIVPVAVPDGGTSSVSVGNISTGVSMNKASTQYVAVDCGTLNVNEFWGAYLDYDPYTKAEIYLPYIGTHALAVDDIMNKAVHVVYHVDILSGACAAYIQCGGSVLYTFIGQCSSSIPISGNDWTNVINGVLSIAGAVGSMVATGGASAPLAVPALASTATNSLKPNVEKSGSMSGTGGMLGVQTPYLILTRPRQALPSRQNEFIGYPSFITRKLSDVSGYTEIESIHIENVPATEQELSEIEALLRGGVIL